MSAALTVKMDETTLARLDAVAAERGATREDMVQIAVEELISSSEARSPALEDWQLALIDEGLAAAERGEFASDEEMEAIFSKYRR